jgi:hypothetical protein
MYVDSEQPEWYLRQCSVCGKEGAVMACWPIGDACCPHCGSLVLPSSFLPSTQPDNQAFDLLPDTEHNREEAETVAADLTAAWEELRNNPPVRKKLSN